MQLNDLNVIPFENAWRYLTPMGEINILLQLQIKCTASREEYIIPTCKIIRADIWVASWMIQYRTRWALLWCRFSHYLWFLSSNKNYTVVIQPCSQAQDKFFCSSRPDSCEKYIGVYCLFIKATSIQAFLKTAFIGLWSTSVYKGDNMHCAKTTQGYWGFLFLKELASN